MRQVIQDLKAGTIRLVDVPVPVPGRGSILIRSGASLVSAGTERMLVEFGKANWLERARQQPDRVRQVMNKMATDGVLATLEAVQRKLDQPMPMGYANVGTVVAVGEECAGYRIGDRVVSNGPHAGFVCVPRNLCALVPDGVDDESAVFCVLGAIALQGVRLAAPTLGETFVVSGLGLVGLLAVQLLRANGCQVVGIDFNGARLALARQFGALTVDLGAGADAVAKVHELTGGQGADGVLICVASDSDEPMRQAAQMSRKRGRIVLVGITGLQLSRGDFYRKELSFQVSCSYGPGRYDDDYEQRGYDYPLPFVRWTEQRNFQAVLQLLAERKLDVKPLISDRFPMSDAAGAYERLASPESLGIVFDYSAETDVPARVVRAAAAANGQGAAGEVSFGVLGVGNYASAMLLPAFRRAGAQLKVLVSARGLSAAHMAARVGAVAAATDETTVLGDPSIRAVIIATRHDKHAGAVVRALAAGKHVFVEKPLATTEADLRTIETAAAAAPECMVMVGFNRRFAPLVSSIKALLDARTGARSFVYTVNAGAIPADHWTQGEEGGGRIVGEACHFVDLLRYLAGAPIAGVQASGAGDGDGRAISDVVTVTLQFANGCLGTVHYFANGSARFPKERLEVFAGGAILVMDNFRSLRGYGWPGLRNIRSWRQDKGQVACARAVVEAVRDGRPAPIPFSELIEVSRVSCQVAQQLRSGVAS